MATKSMETKLDIALKRQNTTKYDNENASLPSALSFEASGGAFSPYLAERPGGDLSSLGTGTLGVPRQANSALGAFELWKFNVPLRRPE
jgi:hypothetical protein